MNLREKENNRQTQENELNFYDGRENVRAHIHMYLEKNKKKGAELARKANISRSMICRLLEGSRECALPTLIKLSRAMEISLDKILLPPNDN